MAQASFLVVALFLLPVCTLTGACGQDGSGRRTQDPDSSAAEIAQSSLEATKKNVKSPNAKNSHRYDRAASEAMTKYMNDTLHYLDASGQKLHQPPGVWFGGGFVINGAAAAGIDKGATSEAEVIAFHMPPNTASVLISTEDVTFMDASIWTQTTP